MYKQLVHDIIESTPITINANGEYSIKHTLTEDLSAIDRSRFLGSRVINTSRHLISLRENVLVIYGYRNGELDNNRFYTSGRTFATQSSDIMLLGSTREEFFQYSTIADYADLEYEDAVLIKEFYDVVSGYMCKNIAIMH